MKCFGSQLPAAGAEQHLHSEAIKHHGAVVQFRGHKSMDHRLGARLEEPGVTNNSAREQRVEEHTWNRG